MQTNIHGKLREKRILQAVLTSGLSKGGTLLLQLVAMPLVARRLGPELFGMFAALGAIPAFFASADFGIGPALGHKLAQAEAAGDQVVQSRFFKAALLFVAVMSAGLLVAGTAAYLTGREGALFGSAFAGHEDILRRNCWILMVIVSLQLVASVGSKARVGLQEIHVNNSFGAVGNFASGACLLLVVWLKPEFGLFLFAIYGVGLLVSSVNLLGLVNGRPYLLTAYRKVHWKDVQALLADSVLYALAIGLLGWQRELAKLLIAREAGAVEVGRLSILLGLASTLGGVVVMVTLPVWPAIADARARNDRAWLQGLWRKLNVSSAGYGLLAALAVGIGGRYFVSALYGANYQIPKGSFWLLGGYFFTMVLGHIRFTWLMGMGRMRTLAAVSSLEFTANMLFFALFHAQLEIRTLLIILLVNHLIFSVSLQEVLVARVRSDMRTPSQAH